MPRAQGSNPVPDRYWEHKYEWAPRQRRLNAFPQFRTKIDGLGIHFVHVRSPHPAALCAWIVFTDIRYWNEPARGGHFAALEQPALFAEEIRACFRALRSAS